ncbi:MAG TPA: hypothetical protein DEQ03_07785, partial [Marinilabiliales bacterium]|nr:hypothetical protein [Marinilabiliales bacterium]
VVIIIVKIVIVVCVMGLSMKKFSSMSLVRAVRLVTHADLWLLRIVGRMLPVPVRIVALLIVAVKIVAVMDVLDLVEVARDQVTPVRSFALVWLFSKTIERILVAEGLASILMLSRISRPVRMLG